MNVEQSAASGSSGPRSVAWHLALIVALNLLSTSPAWGYVNSKFQRYYPQTNDLEGAKAASGMPGMAIDIGVGRPLGAELSVGWFTVDIPGSTLGSGLETGLLVMPVTLSGFAEQRLGRGGVYALGGTGLYGTTSFHGFDVENRVTPGFQLGAGFWMRWFGIEGRYIFASPRIAHRERSIEGLVVGLYFTVR
jgi:hypothetical protein